VDDGESDSEGDCDADGVNDDEVDEVGKAMWDHHQTIYRVFDAYASLGSSADVYHMSANGFNQFVSDCGITIKGHKYCGKSHIDQLFLLVNSSETKKKGKRENAAAEDSLQRQRPNSTKKGAPAAAQGQQDPLAPRGASSDDADAPEGRTGKPGSVDAPSSDGGPATRRRESIMNVLESREIGDGDDGNKRALNRQEFFQCLIRLAIMRYVQPGTIQDVSEAVHELFLGDIEPNLEPAAQQDSNDFRRQSCYIEQTDAVLQRHERSLKAVFKEYAIGDGDVAKGDANLRLGYNEWQQFVKDLKLVNADFTQREVTLCWVWSRMRAVDESNPKTAIKLSNLSIEDFYDALTRVATLMTLPTDEQVAVSKFTDAGALYLDIASKGEKALYTWVEASKEEFETKQEEEVKNGEAVSEERQPIWRSLDALLHLIIRSIESATQGADDLNVTAKEIRHFRSGGGAGGGRR